MPLSSEQPEFYGIILPHWKKFHMELNATSVNFPYLEIFYQSNSLLSALDFTPLGVNFLVKKTSILLHILHARSKVHLGKNRMRSPHSRFWNTLKYFSLFLIHFYLLEEQRQQNIFD